MQKHFALKAGDQVWIPDAIDPYGASKPGLPAWIGEAAENGTYVKAWVGGDCYDYPQFPSIPTFYGDHPEAVGGMEELVVVLDWGNGFPWWTPRRTITTTDVG